jgi:hypothetical protein
VFWSEAFDGPSLDWITPSGHDEEDIARSFRLEFSDGLGVLKARHDARAGALDKSNASKPPPVVHWGKAFRDNPIALEKVQELRWKWRVHQHPDIDSDPWADLAASVYVVTKMPGLFPGRGFKFGWLAQPGKSGKKQRGLVQIALRSGPPIGQWQEEKVDLCTLYQQYFGTCKGQSVMYVGVVTDADNTRSVSEADYTEFELIARQ